MMLPQSSTPDTDPPSRNISKKPRRPHTKTRTGCRICRRRKVKCDETHPTCKNCQRRGLEDECDYAYGEVVPAFASGGVGGVTVPPVAPGWPIPPGNPISPNQHLTPVAAAGEFTLWAAGSSTVQTPVPQAHNGSRDASSCNIYSPTSQYSPASMHTPTQTPSQIPSCLPFTLNTQIPKPNDLTTATLVHLFTTLTALSCSTQRSVQLVYSTHAPRQALRLARTHPEEMGYLLYSLLAVAALHAAALASHAGREKDMLAIRSTWMTIADEYHAWTLKGFMVAVQNFAASVHDHDLQGAWKGKETIAKLTKSEDANKGHGYKVVRIDSGSNRPEEDGQGVEEKTGQPGQREGTHWGVARYMHLHLRHNPAIAAEEFSKLDKERVDELEAILLAAGLLMLYALASDKLQSETFYTSGATTSYPKAATTPWPVTTCTTNTTSAATLSASVPVQRPILSWVPLLRGTPTMIYHSPIGWLVFTQGNLAPLSAGLFKRLAPDHPYEPKLAHLRHNLFTPAYIPDPNLPPPLYPMTVDTFENVMERLIQCFARFFGGGDFLAAAMSFPAAVEGEFWLGLGVGSGNNNGLGHAAASAKGHEGTKDPRALVVMAYALVLLVLVVGMFPAHSEEVHVGEDVYELLGIGLMDLGDDEGPDSGGDEREFELDSDGGGGLRTVRKLKHSRYLPPKHPANALSPTWWIAGVGEREIMGIARYLDTLDTEERRAAGMEARMVEGRWMKWMEWPLEIIKNGGEDVMGMLKEAAQ